MRTPLLLVIVSIVLLSACRSKKNNPSAAEPTMLETKTHVPDAGRKKTPDVSKAPEKKVLTKAETFEQIPLVKSATRLVVFSSKEKLIAASEDDFRGDGGACCFNAGAGKRPPKSVSEIEVTKQQAQELIEILADPTSYDENSAACHDPHLGLAFYNKKKKPEHIITICIDCANSGGTNQIPEIKDRLTDLEIYGLGTGIDRIHAWCKTHNIPHCLDHQPHWREMEYDE